MVEPEHIEATKQDVSYKVVTFHGKDFYRKANGKWYWDLIIQIDITLPDGRILQVNEIVTTRPKQKGRKPRANPFGGETKTR